eukprot:9502041-Pyramimonas_sp.AAC.1
MSGQMCINSSTAYDLRPMRCELRSMHTSLSNAGSRRRWTIFVSFMVCLQTSQGRACALTNGS